MARKLAIDGQAVAYVVLEELLGEDKLRGVWAGPSGSLPSVVAHHVLEAADVEFQPRARKLILTFDLSGEPGSLEVPPLAESKREELEAAFDGPQ